MARRDLLGVLLLALVGSSVVSIMMMGEKTDVFITLLPAETPEKVLKASGERTIFSVGMITRRKIQSLEMRFGFLAQVDDWMLSLHNASSYPTFRRVVEEEETEIEPIAGLSRIAMGMGLETDPIIRSFGPDSGGNKLAVWDFAALEVGRSVDFPLRTLYGLMFDHVGRPVGFYEGVWDFCIGREALLEIETDLEGTTKTYKAPAEVGKGEDGEEPFPLDSVLKFNSVPKDSKILVSFSVNGLKLPDSRSYLQIIRIYADGQEAHEPLIELIGG